MSIFKQSFDKSVKDQIAQRENKIQQGDRTYYLQRQCTVRLASGVDIDITDPYDEPNSNIAKKNILQGGIVRSSTFTTTNEETGETTSNFTQNLRGGFEDSYDTPVDGFGRVPMPGITSVNIKTKTAYGSLREAIVNFECHNTRQLDILEKLYMRPGYPCLLEWGLVPFINNTGGIEQILPFISQDKDFFDSPNQLKKENDNDIQEAIQRIIKENKVKYSNNYDGMYGIVKNFNYSIRPDGGYSCTTELIAIGEVIDSIKGPDGDENSSVLFLEEVFEDLNEYAFSLSEVGIEGGDDYDTLRKGQSFFNAGSSTNNVGSYDPGEPIPREQRSPFEESKKVGVRDYYSINQDQKTARRRALKEKLQDQGINTDIHLKSLSTNFFLDIKPMLYIRWDTMCDIFNHYLNDVNLIRFDTVGVDGEELRFNNNSLDVKTNNFEPKGVENIVLNGRSKDDFPLEKLSRISNFDLSMNPKVCLFPENWKQYYGGSANWIGSNLIRNIWFEASYLYKTFKSMYFIIEEDVEKFNPDFSIGKFVQKIWDDVNTSCGGTHNFQIQSEFNNPNTIKIIDLEFQSDIDKETIHQFNVLSLNSIVRTFSYDLTIPNALTSTIAIAAQDAGSPQNLQEVTIRSFNKGLKNRFYHPINSKVSKTSDRFLNIKNRAHTKIANLLAYTNRFDIYEAMAIHDQSIVLRPGFQKYWEFIEAICEVQLFLERLKGLTYLESQNEDLKKYREKYDEYEYGRSAASDVNFQAGGLDINEVLVNQPGLAEVINYQEFRRRELNDNGEPKLEKQHEWNLCGNSYADFDFIPPSDINKAQKYLKQIIKLKRELQNYKLEGEFINFQTNGIFELKEDIKTDITTIIPLKLSLKLDGLSGIIIGNIFNIAESRLPKTYKDTGVSFIVTGESQEITGQDWITTITGQTVLL